VGIRISQIRIPIIHHQIDKITDSSKKILSISLVLIPMALSIPISLVLSATQANITFIIPIPDTTSTMIATQVRRRVIVFADS